MLYTAIIGNVTNDPVVRDTKAGKVTNFNVAVNVNKTKTEYFKVAAFKELGINAAKYLAKGRKCAVTGIISASAYSDRDGKPQASLELLANTIEYLTPKSEQQKVVAESKPMPNYDEPMTETEEEEEDELF